MQITHIVNCTSNLPNYLESNPAYRYLRLPLQDRVDQDLTHVLTMALLFIHKALSENPSHRVLIHCFAGRSRSPSIAIAYLAWRDHLSFDEAFSRVNQRRETEINEGFRDQLRAPTQIRRYLKWLES